VSYKRAKLEKAARPGKNEERENRPEEAVKNDKHLKI